MGWSCVCEREREWGKGQTCEAPRVCVCARVRACVRVRARARAAARGTCQAPPGRTHAGCGQWQKPLEYLPAQASVCVRACVSVRIVLCVVCCDSFCVLCVCARACARARISGRRRAGVRAAVLSPSFTLLLPPPPSPSSLPVWGACLSDSYLSRGGMLNLRNEQELKRTHISPGETWERGGLYILTGKKKSFPRFHGHEISECCSARLRVLGREGAR